MCRKHAFQFLTKNPAGYYRYYFPEQAWLGTSINSDEDRERAEILRRIKTHASVKYLSIEPIQGDISFSLEGFNWIIIGAQTGSNPVTPQRQWVASVLKKCDRLKIPLFMKNNLRPFYGSLLQQFP